MYDFLILLVVFPYMPCAGKDWPCEMAQKSRGEPGVLPVPGDQLCLL